MAWRQISVVTLAGASIGLVALGARTPLAADSVAPDGEAAPATEYAVVRSAGGTASPVLDYVTPIVMREPGFLQGWDEGTRLSGHTARRKGKAGSDHARSCTVFVSPAIERKVQAVVRRGAGNVGEIQSAPRIALILGVAF
jgi:hypothetical protein